MTEDTGAGGWVVVEGVKDRVRYHGDETAVSCPVSRVPISPRLPSLLDQVETEFLSPFLRGGGAMKMLWSQLTTSQV